MKDINKKNFLNSEYFLSILSSSLIGFGYLVNIYLNNVGQIYFKEVLISLQEYFLVVILFSLIVAIFFRKMIIYLPLGLALLFLWEPIRFFISINPIQKFDGELSLIIILVTFIFLVWHLRKIHKKDLIKFSFGFSVILFITPIFSSFQTFQNLPEDNIGSIVELRRKAIGFDDLPSEAFSKKFPDIIYIVPDRYASSDSLMEYYKWDNSDFYNALKKRGFIVNKNSVSNYPITSQSLASNLNATYLDKFTHDYPTNEKPLFALIENNWVQESLRNLDYKYMHFGFWWEPTAVNKYADWNFANEIEHNFYNFKISRLGIMLLSKTPFLALTNRLMPRPAQPLRGCYFTMSKINTLKNIQTDRDDHPVFIYVHMEIPHPPHYFNENGDCQRPGLDKVFFNEESWSNYKNRYVNYLRFANNSLLDIFDAHTNNKKRDLIFVIQSDEGPYPFSWKRNNTIPNPVDFNDWELKSGIINAIYTSSPNGIRSNDLKTPINNWIYIFNDSFGTNIEHLDHEVFGIKSGMNLYEFINISHMISQKEDVEPEG